MSKRFGRATAALLASALAGCSGPSDTWIVNATGHRLTITQATYNAYDKNVANGSPWFWPWRTDPKLSPGGSHMLTAMCYGCTPEWTLKVRIADCELDYRITPPPDTGSLSPEWRLARAYDEDAVLIGRDLQLYRVPTRATMPYDYRALPQPQGYPAAPLAMSAECKNLPISPDPIW